ncbi:MAG: haloacid dehalogenase-like hydrolase [Oscillospiraceae bacterium]|nr:haloacid dehalogenase-like hydrolase [Oscillospiraceae bacterium]
MNCYDFDQTLFFPDSSYLFVMYCLRHYPRAVLRALPGACFAGALKLLSMCETRVLKEKLFSFLPYLDDIDRIVEEFWAENYDNGISQFYLLEKRDDDVIISASPEFLLRPAAERLGVRLIATRMDRHTGRIIGNNCHDYEKVTRFYREYPDERVDAFYSDSITDFPMARLAERAYLVEGRGTLRAWPKQKGCRKWA